MKSLYESILKTNNASVASIFDKAIDAYEGGGRRLTIDVPFDFFCHYLSYENFKKICDSPLDVVRKERQRRGPYAYAVKRTVNIVLKDGTIVFIFMKDGGFIYWRSLYVSKPIISYYDCPESFDNADKNGMSWCGRSTAVSPDQQMKFWFGIFKEKVDNLKKSYTKVK